MNFKIPVSILLIAGLCALMFQSCRSTKFVPDGEYLLASADIKSDTKAISAWESNTYIKQKPNFKTFEIFKLPLTIYNLSGSDTTKWVNRVLRNAGEPPVIYDSTMVGKTVIDLKRMVTNKGYLNAEVTPIVTLRGKKARITYDIKAGEPYRIDDYKIDVPDSSVSNISTIYLPNRSGDKNAFHDFYINMDSLMSRSTLVKRGNVFDLDVLDKERDRITSRFRRIGYYAFNKEYVGFVADTTVGTHQVDLDLVIHPFNQTGVGGQTMSVPHRQYVIQDINMYVDFDPLEDGDISRYRRTSVYQQDGYNIIYGPRGEYIRPQVLLDNCFIRPGMMYDEGMITYTYSALSQLKILKNVNISFSEFIENDSTKLHCTITCVPDKRQGISAEIEGTNSGGLSGGFFGIGGSLGYLHRNVFRGSELFSIKAFGSYEAITPSFTSFNDNYFEVGGEMSLTFPRFMTPFLSSEFKRGIHANTQFTTDYTFQRRPGFFTRTVLSTGMKYIWQSRRQSTVRHAVDLIDVSYIHIPNLDKKFEADLSPAALWYSFRDQFIMSTGYTYTKTNVNVLNRNNPSIYSLRASVETAGNLLSLIAKLADVEKDELGSREVFGTHFAQYARGTLDYSRTIRIDEKNAFAWRLGGGLAYPYGNFKQVPVQKRFFSGGANSVRGWAVRELGPGSMYKAGSNFYDHSGEIRFDAGVEYRSKIFWVIELGAFIDAGNIWTVNNYEEQPGGQFKFDKFYKEIAVAWGLGLRLDFDFVLIRLDCGWKAYDPANNPNKTKWPITKPLKIKDNTAWHIAIGYPF